MKIWKTIKIVTKVILASENVLIMNLIKQNNTKMTENREIPDPDHISDY